MYMHVHVRLNSSNKRRPVGQTCCANSIEQQRQHHRAIIQFRNIFPCYYMVHALAGHIPTRCTAATGAANVAGWLALADSQLPPEYSSEFTTPQSYALCVAWVHVFHGTHSFGKAHVSVCVDEFACELIHLGDFRPALTCILCRTQNHVNYVAGRLRIHIELARSTIRAHTVCNFSVPNYIIILLCMSVSPYSNEM